MTDSEDILAPEGARHRRHRLTAVRAPIPVLLGAAVALALPAAAAAATPKLPVSNTAITVPGPYPPLSGVAGLLSGDINLGWHGPPPPKPVVNLPEIATIVPGPYPPLSGISPRPYGDASIGWHGPPPPDAVLKRAVARSSHHRQLSRVYGGKK